jgi:hypothetical protein
MTRQYNRFKDRQGKVYEEFGREVCPGFDYSNEALIEFYEFESTGKPVSNERNGFALGKKWAGVAVDQWEQDIKNGLLHISEIEKDYIGHDWFLKDIRARVAKFERQRFGEGRSFGYGLMVELARG